MLRANNFLSLGCNHRHLSCWFILGQDGPVRVDFQLAGHLQALQILRRWGGVIVREGELDAWARAATELRRRFNLYLDGKALYLYRKVPPFPFLAAATPFQQKVWREIKAIPYGETRSYGEIGESIGGRVLARAVGQSCGANPCPLVIPCHRVVGSGSPGGFAGGTGLKSLLLAIEASKGADRL